LAANAKTYVFPTYNCADGIQINHFGTSGSLVNPATNVTAGGGTNTSVTAAPSVYDFTNFCSGVNLKLEGTTDTSSLSATITDYSDGYKATSTVSLETFMGGAYGSWRGYCLVYYSS